MKKVQKKLKPKVGMYENVLPLAEKDEQGNSDADYIVQDLASSGDLSVAAPVEAGERGSPVPRGRLLFGVIDAEDVPGHNKEEMDNAFWSVFAVNEDQQA